MKTQHWMKLGLALIVVGSLPACQTTQGETPSEQEAVGAATEALGSSCWRADPDDTATGGVSTAITTPQTYDNAGCYRGYVVDIERYSPRFTSDCSNGQGLPGATWIDWADTEPTSKAACEGASIIADVFKRVTTTTDGVMERSWEYAGRQQANGVWTPKDPGAFLDLSGCRLGLSVNGFMPNETYRLALTGRSSSNMTRSIKIQTREKSCVR